MTLEPEERLRQRIAQLEEEIARKDAEIAHLRGVPGPGGASGGPLAAVPSQPCAVWDHVGAGVLVVGEDARIQDANDTLCTMLGREREQVVGHPVLDFVHPDDLRLVERNLELGREGRVSSFRTERRLLHAQGWPVWVDQISRAVPAEDGSVRCYVSLVIDITERKKTEAAVWENEERLRTLVETLPVLIHAHDEAGNYVFWNKECERVLGYRAEEIIGNPDARAMLFPDPEYREHLAREHGLMKDRDTMEALTRAADGTDRTILWTRIKDATPMPGWTNWETGIDITARQRAETALLASENEKKIILDTISESVLYQTPDKRILWANRAACRLSGVTPEELRGLRCYEVWHGYKKSCSTRDCPVERALNLGDPVEAEVEGEGGRTWQVKGYPTRDDSGAIIGAIEVARDITDRKRIEDEMRRARDLAENATKMKDEFLANMSHELRSPLNGVLGMLDVLLDTDLDTEQRDCIETALQAGEGLLAIINDILDFSKLQADKIGLSYNEFNLRSTVRTVCNTFREQSRRKGLEVSYRFEDNVPERLVGDEGRIRQILFNLVGNSVKFTRQGSVRVEVFLLRKSNDPDRARLLVNVADTGIGIPPEAIETIFDPFVQLNWAKSRKFEGTGLGLGIVKRLVTLMGGIVTVESEVGTGTTVSFWINVGLP